MKAIQAGESGTPESLFIAEVEEPEPRFNQMKISVYAAGVNRADTMQRVGKYPPPPGVTEIMGLEVAGEVVGLGEGVNNIKIGDRIMALLPGGGYAQYAVADQGSVMTIPHDMSYTDAAGICEVFLTAYQALFLLGKLKEDQTVLIHAGASGVGTAAIQLAKRAGAIVIVTAGTDEKCIFCKDLGADLAINYRSSTNFDQLAMEFTAGHGVDLLIDFVGADYVSRNIDAMAMDGRIVMLAFMSGANADGVNLAKILTKRITFMGSTLRARSNEYKTDLVHGFQKNFFHLFNEKKLKPIIDSVYHWNKGGEAHQRIEDNLNIGKIILQVE